MSFAHLLLEQPEPGVYLLTLNRPHALNALDRATLRELHAAAERLEQDREARVLLVTGAGERAFAAGADIAEMRQLAPEQAEAFSALGSRAFAKIEALAFPTIALVNGYALGGGCELALACDWAIASERAVFGQPEVGLGLCPGFGGTQRLARRIGRARALELLTTGRRLDAHEAAALGLVNAVVPAAELLQRGLATARAICANAPLAVRCTKEAVVRGAELALADALALETRQFALCYATLDREEGLRAFFEKRPPRFRGR